MDRQWPAAMRISSRLKAICQGVCSVLSDMDGSAGGGCRHYTSLAEAVSVCDSKTIAPKGCVPSDASGQRNGCTCGGITKEDGGSRPFRLGAFPLVNNGAATLSWQRSATSCNLFARVFLLSVLTGLVMYLGIGGYLQARNEGSARCWAVPHRQQWLHLHGLVRDGFYFVVGRGELRGQRSHSILTETLNARSPKKSNKKTSRSLSKAKTGKTHSKAQANVGALPPALPSPVAHDLVRETTCASNDDRKGGSNITSGVVANGSRTPSCQAGDGGRWVKIDK